MKKPMISYATKAIAIAICLAAGAAHAERNVQRGSHSVDKTRTTANGTFTRHTEQTATDNGFTRASVATNAAGKTATRNVSVANDAATGTHTRDVSGSTFNGKTYSGSSVTQKTDDGYTRSGSITGPNGNSASRDAVVSIDKSAGTASKTVTATGPNGETRSVSKTLTKTVN